MNLFYSNNIDNDKGQISLTDQENRHLIKVLRKSIGEVISVTDGIGNIYKCEIINTDKTSSTLSIINIDKNDSIFPKLSIAISLTKKTNRFEWFLEKASEIGITEISPLICNRSERKFINEKRLKKVLVSAMKQSLKTHLPVLNQLTRLKDFIKRKSDDQLFIAHCNDSKKNPLLKSIKPKSKITILIGPEGDFTESEVEEALKAGFKPVSLGNSRFRAETAAIIASHTVSITNM